MTTDNGPQFISGDFKSYLESYGIQHICTALYHPQANRGVERFHQSLKNGLRAHLVQGCPFSQAIHFTLLHYRAFHHCTMCVSSAFLMLDRELKLLLDWLRSPVTQRSSTQTSLCLKVPSCHLSHHFPFRLVPQAPQHHVLFPSPHDLFAPSHDRLT